MIKDVTEDGDAKVLELRNAAKNIYTDIVRFLLLEGNVTNNALSQADEHG